MKLLSHTYHTLKRCELTDSQYDFSTRWLGAGKSYFSWIKAANAEPSIGKLTRLAMRIERKIEELDAEPDPIFPEVTAHDAAVLRSLHDKLLETLKQQCQG